jgi:MFS family permease
MLGLSQAEGYGMLLFLTGLAGFCAEMYRPAATALIADVTTPAQRVTAFSVYRLAINLGFAVGPAVGGLIAHRSFFLLFVGDAITSLVYAGIALAMIPNRVVEHHSQGERRSAVRAIAHDASFLAYLGATLMASMVFMQHVSGYPLQMDAYGYSSRVYGLLISINGLLICLVELPLTTFTRRRRARTMMMTGMIVFGAAFVATGFVSTIPLLAAAVVVWTIGEMFYFPVAAAHIASVSPPDMRGRYQGAWGIAWGLGAVVGPVVGTMVFAWNPRALWLACGGCAVAGSLLLIPGTRRRERDAAAGSGPAAD